VLHRFVDRGQVWAMPLSLRRVGGLPILALAVAALLQVKLPPQALQVEVAQRIRTQTAGLEELVRGHVRVLLQQVRYPAEDGGRDAIGMEALEQKQRLEVGVGGDASIHPPGVCSARAMGVERNRSQRDERQRLCRAAGHGMRRGRWARQEAKLWEMGRRSV
jgi:hypothetical protein